MIGNKRPAGMSLLDYLWVNYSDYATSNEVTNNPEHTILSQLGVLQLLLLVSGISDLLMINGSLVGFDSNGNQLFEINDINLIKDFGRRTVTQADLNKGCELPIGSPVYYLKTTTDNEYLAPTDTYHGTDGKTIAVSLVENAIYAELKISKLATVVPIKKNEDGISIDLQISERQDSILLSKESDGLRALIVLDNSDKFLRFSLLTLDEYLSLENKDETTLYFIKGKKYFYFGDILMVGGNSGSLDNYYSKTEIDEKLSNYVTKQELDEALADYGLDWNLYI